MIWIERIICLIRGHRDLRIVSVDMAKGFVMYRCASCNSWWTE